MSAFMNAAVVAIIYFLFRLFEMRIILKENKPLKSVLRDSLLVYLSVLAGDFLLDQLSPLANGLPSQPSVFTNDPEF